MGETDLDDHKKRLLKLIVPAVCAVVIVVALLAVYFSPALSWSSSIRDRDGDGVPDSKDAFPNDPKRSLPIISLSIAAENHNWTLKVEDIIADPGRTITGIAFSDIQVEAIDSTGNSVLLTSLSTLAKNRSASGVTYVDTGDRTSINGGDAFVLSLSEYRPGSLFNLSSTVSEGFYASIDLLMEAPSATGGKVWSSESFRWTFTSLSPPVQWEDVSIHISDSQNEASWSPIVRDDDANLSLPVSGFGPMSLACTLNSGVRNNTAVYDNMIDSGDNFTITPSSGFAPEKVYRVTVVYDFGGEIASCSFSLSGPVVPTPTLDISLATLQSDLVFVQFSSVNGVLSWDDIAILLSGGTATIVWIVNASELDGGGLSTTVCGASALDIMWITCTAGDLTGNGVADDGDGFQLTANPGFLDYMDYRVTVMYKPHWQEMASLSFAGQPVTPTSSLTKSAVSNGVKFTFAPFSADTQWGDVTILLTDGSNTVAWSPQTIDLLNVTTATWNYFTDTANLGTLKVNITVVDLAGNGYVNQGDYFALRLGNGQTFSTATTYTVTIMHDPTASEVCHISFVG